MKRFRTSTLLLALALFDALASAAFWTAKGANMGWTKTQVEVVTVDEVTGLERRTWQKRFVPGVEFLGVCWLGAGAVATIGWLLRKQESKRSYL